jgi:hypothetical protein
MPDVHYTHGKLGTGVEILARHPGRVQERLIEAFHHALHAVDPDALSQPGINHDARVLWDEVWATVTAAGLDQQRGTFEPSIERLTDEEASRVAQLIVSIDAMVGDSL